MTQSNDDFRDLLNRVSRELQAERRLSYRGLKRRFGLSDDDLADIKDELIHARRVAGDENGTVLVWQPEAAPGVDRAVGDEPSQRPYPSRYFKDPGTPPRAAIEGEKKLVTILFCDVANSMLLAERLGPEGWHETMSAMFSALTEAIHALKGTVNQFTGDGLLAVFGAPIAHEDHALHACIAALRIQAAVGRLADTLRREHDLSLKLRIGINTGEVVMGTIGDALRSDYTAQGQVVGIAARLENLADPGTILLSEFSYREIAGACEVLPRGLRTIKGCSDPIEVFELLNVRADASRFTAARRRGLSRFVGRSAELHFLESLFERATAGDGGRVVGIVGEPGMGKSRLVYEFLEGCRARGVLVLIGQALSHGTNIPFLPILKIFREYYGIGEGEAPESARGKIHSRLTRMGGDYADAIPLVQEFLGFAAPDAPPLNIDPDAKQRRLFDLLRRTVQGADLSQNSVLACIEDLHWIDQGSERFIEHWVDALPGSRRLLIVSFRPGYRAPWMNRPWYHELRLGPLSAGAVRELLEAMIGADPSTIGLADNIFQRTGGNPFFCEEIVQALRQSGDLSSVPGTYRLHRPLTELQIPPSIQSVLAARIDGLGSHEKTLLQNAAVIGRDFSSALLAQISDLTRARVTEVLLVLKDAGFVFENPSRSADDYAFKHALTQEVALQSQLRDRRRRIHARVAEGIEALHPGKLGKTSSLRAYHWENAGEPLAAAQAYGQAAVQIRGSDRALQMNYIRKVLQLTQELPDTPDRMQLRLQVLVELIAGGAWRFTMSDEELDRLCDEARRLADAAGLRELSLMIRSGRAAATGMMAGEVDAWHGAIAALAAEVEGASAEVIAAVRGQYSYALYASGQLAVGLDVALASQDLAGDDPRFGQAMGYSILGAMLNCVALLRVALGRMDEAFRTYQQAIEVLGAAGAVEELLWNMANQSESVYPLGLPADHPWVVESLRHAQQAHDRAEQVASDFTRGVAKRGLVVALINCGRFAEAERAAQDCLQHLRSRRAHLEVEARCLAYLAEVQLRLGKIAEARSAAQAAVARSRQQGARYFECCALVSLARCLIEAPAATDEADAVLGQAQAIAEVVGCAGLAPQIHELQAQVDLLRGAAEPARQRLRATLTLYRQVGAHGHADRVEGLLA